MKLPSEFLKKMEKLLDEKEYAGFLESYNQPRYYGLRVNTLKIPVGDFLGISPFDLEPVPWTSDGFYYPEGESPGRHPFYHAGLYYIQEPSAMLPGQVLGALPGERVLDLCAAPGGKTVQIAAAMKGKGLLIANDINADRVKALVKNIELCGVRNAIVLNETPEKLAQRFAGWFDRILVDAPCSGEGMFRKDEDAARSWESFKCEVCSGMQRDILRSVDRLLRPGGTLVYSTCTFSPEEDEAMISHFLNENRDYEVVEIPKTAGIESGRPEWAGGRQELVGTARLWPHRVKGEGHFVAKLRKAGGSDNPGSSGNPAGSSRPGGPVYPGNSYDTHSGKHHEIQRQIYTARYSGSADLPGAYAEFVRQNLNATPEGFYFRKGRNLYLLPESPPELDGLKVAKFGWFLGEVEGDRFEPSHSLATALEKGDFKRFIDLDPDSREVRSYLKGETLMIEGEKGLTGVCAGGYSLGWAKQTGDMLKNLYPKGWRKMN